MASPRSILFAGGGSGGHIAPLLAVMAEVHTLAPDCACSYVGLTSDLEWPPIKESSLPFSKHAISAGKFNRYLTLKNLSQPWQTFAGYTQAYALLKSTRPDLIFAKGGFVSVPVALAAASLKIPVYTHETDITPGLANRLIARVAKTIFTAFPVKGYQRLPQEKLVHVGQPVRRAFRQHTSQTVRIQGKEIAKDRPLLTIIGGSQGAHRINELIAASWPSLLDRVTLVHICGKHDLSWLQGETEELSASQRANLHLTDYVQDELPTLFQRSALVVSRAGGTVAELAAAGAAAVLIPLSTASQDHQGANARFFAEAGAVRLFDEVSGTAEQLTTLITHLLDQPEERQALSQKLASFDRPEAAATIARALVGN